MICVMGDTHGDYSRFSHKALKRLKKGDHLIICGDFGFVWDGSEKEWSVLKKIGAKKYTTLFLTGGHDNTSLLEQYPECELFGGRGRHICGNLYMLSSGEIFNVDGASVFAFGGGQSADSADEAESAADEELFDEACLEAARNRLAEHGGRVDYIFTHEPPGSIAEFLTMNDPRRINMGQLNIFFDRLKESAEFKMWFFGKLHKNKSVPSRYMAVFDEPYFIE